MRTINSSPLTVNRKLKKPQQVNCQQLTVNCSERGFTLVELIVVFSILTILSLAGLLSLITYTRLQIVNAAREDLLVGLNLAKSRAQSQVKPSGCSGTLSGYQMGFCELNQLSCLPIDVGSSPKSFAVYAVCDGLLIPVSSKTYTAGVTLESSYAYPQLLFTGLSGGVTGASPTTFTVRLSGVSDTRSITVYPDGRIVSN